MNYTEYIIEKSIEDVEDQEEGLELKIKSIFSKILDTIETDEDILEGKKHGKKKKEKKEKPKKLKKEHLNDIVENLTEFLEVYKYKLLSSKKINIDKPSLDRIQKEIEDKTDKFLLKELNLDIFFRTLRKSAQMITDPNEAREYISEFFEDYISSLRKRINNILHYYQDIKDIKKEVRDKEYPLEYSILPSFSYDEELKQLQIELNKLIEWIVKENKKILLIFEGRDAAGKGGIIKVITENINPKYYRIENFGIPTLYQKRNWFHRYQKVLPKAGELVLFDRSWYNRAVVDPAMGYCTKEQYDDFMQKVVPFEEKLMDSGTIIMKFWFSITKETQLDRFEARKESPLRYWKYTENDAKSLSKWDVVSRFKQQMFEKTSTDKCPWTIIDSNDKKAGRTNTIRYILRNLDYPEKNYEELEKFYPEVCYII